MAKIDKPVIFSIIVATILGIILIITIFICLFFSWGSTSAFKDSIAIVGSLFGGCATLATGLIATFLFNDWKEQHNKTVIAEEAKNLLISINDDIEVITSISGTLRNKDRDILFHEIYDDELSKKIKRVSENIYKISSKALILYELSEDKELSEIRDKYDKNTIELQKRILQHLNENNKIGDILDMFDEILPKFIYNNKIYKKKVRSYILAN